MRNFYDVNKGNLMKEVYALRRSGHPTPYAAAAEKFNCCRERVKEYVKNHERKGNGKGFGQSMTTEELMRHNDRIEVRSRKNPRLVVYCDASRRDNALAMLEAMGG